MKTLALCIGFGAVVIVLIGAVVSGLYAVWRGDWGGLGPLIGLVIGGLIIYGTSDDF